jgi:hypothetical protein
LKGEPFGWCGVLIKVLAGDTGYLADALVVIEQVLSGMSNDSCIWLQSEFEVSCDTAVCGMPRLN